MNWMGCLALCTWIIGGSVVVWVNSDYPDPKRVIVAALLWPLFAIQGVIRESIRYTREIWK